MEEIDFLRAAAALEVSFEELCSSKENFTREFRDQFDDAHGQIVNLPRENCPQTVSNFAKEERNLKAFCVARFIELDVEGKPGPVAVHTLRLEVPDIDDWDDEAFRRTMHRGVPTEDAQTNVAGEDGLWIASALQFPRPLVVILRIAWEAFTHGPIFVLFKKFALLILHSVVWVGAMYLLFRVGLSSIQQAPSPLLNIGDTSPPNEFPKTFASGESTHGFRTVLEDFRGFSNYSGELWIAQVTLEAAEDNIAQAMIITKSSPFHDTQFLLAAQEKLALDTSGLYKEVRGYRYHIRSMVQTSKTHLRIIIHDLSKITFESQQLRPIPRLATDIEEGSHFLGLYICPILIVSSRRPLTFLPCAVVWAIQFISNELRCLISLTRSDLKPAMCTYILKAVFQYDTFYTSILHARAEVLEKVVSNYHRLLTTLDDQIQKARKLLKEAQRKLENSQGALTNVETLHRSILLEVQIEEEMIQRREQERDEAWAYRHWSKRGWDFCRSNSKKVVETTYNWALRKVQLRDLGTVSHLHSNMSSTFRRTALWLDDTAEHVKLARHNIGLKQILAYNTFCVPVSHAMDNGDLAGNIEGTADQTSAYRQVDCGTDEDFTGLVRQLIHEITDLQPVLETLENEGIMFKRKEEEARKREQEVRDKCITESEEKKKSMTAKLSGTPFLMDESIINAEKADCEMRNFQSWLFQGWSRD